MAGRFETPPSLAGQPEQQLRQLGRYLFRLSEKLNVETQSADGADSSDALSSVKAEQQSRQAADMALNRNIAELRAQLEALNMSIGALENAVCADAQGNAAISGSLTLGGVTLTPEQLSSLLNNLEGG